MDKTLIFLFIDEISGEFFELEKKFKIEINNDICRYHFRFHNGIDDKCSELENRLDDEINSEFSEL
jgi:hypothetical protein